MKLIESKKEFRENENYTKSNRNLYACALAGFYIANVVHLI